MIILQTDIICKLTSFALHAGGSGAQEPLLSTGEALRATDERDLLAVQPRAARLDSFRVDDDTDVDTLWSTDSGGDLSPRAHGAGPSSQVLFYLSLLSVYSIGYCLCSIARLKQKIHHRYHRRFQMFDVQTMTQT